jgi:hypothetical protein
LLADLVKKDELWEYGEIYMSKERLMASKKLLILASSAMAAVGCGMTSPSHKSKTKATVEAIPERKEYPVAMGESSQEIVENAVKEVEEKVVEKSVSAKEDEKETKEDAVEKAPPEQEAQKDAKKESNKDAKKEANKEAKKEDEESGADSDPNTKDISISGTSAIDNPETRKTEQGGEEKATGTKKEKRRTTEEKRKKEQ